MAACRGNRSTAARRAPSVRRVRLGRLAHDSRHPAGNGEASADTAPTAPPSMPRWMSASGPTKTSRPSPR